MLNAKPIVELVSEKPEYLELSSLDIPAWKGAGPYSSYPKTTLYGVKDTVLCITSLKPHHREKAVYMDYLDDHAATNTVLVPNDFLASILPPEKLAAMKAKYDLARERSKFRTELYFSGTCGTDPEIFVEDKKGQIIPAFKFLGPKSNPYKCELSKNCGYGWRQNNAYWDGFQAEFDVQENSCFSGVADSIHFGLQGVLKKAREFDKKCKLSMRTVFDIPPEMIIEANPEHVQFGCMPSSNAYSMKGKDTPGHEVPFRPAGGHIHLGIYQLKQDQAVSIVKAMDAILGVACVSLFAQFDDPRRRELYGLAGEYRLPKHGLEYRVLSNAWLSHPLIAHLVFDLARTAAMVGTKGMLDRWECSEAETVRIINSCDVNAAREVLKKNETFLKRLLEVKYMNWWTSGKTLDPYKAAEYAYDVFMNGMESVIKDPLDVEGNWNLLGAKSKCGKGSKVTDADYSNKRSDDKWQLHSDGPGKNVMFVFKHKLEKEKV